MSKMIRLAVVGCGDIASTRHIPAIHAHPEAQLAALCDSDLEKARRLAAEYDVPIFTTDYKELLEDKAIDAVVVATPPWVTPKITIEFLRAGKDVLCEKPMALSLEAAGEVRDAERETGKHAQVGFTYRHDPLLATLKGWIRDGRLGAPLVFRMGIFDEIWDPEGNPEHYDRIITTMEHGIPSIHDGAHIADFLNFLTDSPVEDVQSFGFKSRAEFPASNYDTSIIHFKNGDMAKVEIGWMYPVFPKGEFEVLGPNGIAVFDRHERYVELTTPEGTERIRHEENWWDACFRIQLDRFLSSIRDGHPFVPGTAEGIYSLGLTKSIEASVRRNRPMSD